MPVEKQPQNRLILVHPWLYCLQGSKCDAKTQQRKQKCIVDICLIQAGTWPV